MPELTKSSVGSFDGTSELEATMAWPLDLKYSRKLERISLDFIAIILLQGGRKTRERRPAVPENSPSLPRDQALMRPYLSRRARTAPIVRSCCAASSCSARP